MVPGPDLRDYEYDMFISYARVDNLSATGEPGWVTLFHKHLEVELARRLGRADRVRIWRDEELAGNELFDDVIKRRIAGSALFLALTSQGHLESDYCQKELRWFHECASRRKTGLSVSERQRVLNVLLNNIPHKKWPRYLGKTVGFPFYQTHDKGDLGWPLEPTDPEFRNRLRTLVDAIYETMCAFPPADEETTAGGPVLVHGSSPAYDVYVAPVAFSLSETRSDLIGKLTRRGITVCMTDIPPPWDAEGHRNAALVAIEQAALSVHLLDANPFSEVTDGGDTPCYACEQALVGRESTHPQVIWVPRSLNIASIHDEQHRELLEALEAAQGAERTYEFIRSNPSDLADDIAQSLRHLHATSPLKTTLKAVLVDVQISDQLKIMNLCRTLLDNNVLPYINPQEPDPRRNEEILRSRLAEVDALIIVYGHADMSWVRSRLDQAINMATSEGYSLKTFCIYLAPPDETKEDLCSAFETLNLRVLDNRKGFDPDSLTPLYEDLGTKRPLRAIAANPFVGLRPFNRNEALLFFGRHEQIIEFLDLLHCNRFIGVVGSSGCGKSSLVHAGLIPKLMAGMLVEERERWIVATMQPGSRPLLNLARSIIQSLPKVPTPEANAMVEVICGAVADLVTRYWLLPWIAKAPTSYSLSISSKKSFALARRNLAMALGRKLWSSSRCFSLWRSNERFQSSS
jgi:hypothetical protein